MGRAEIPLEERAAIMPSAGMKFTRASSSEFTLYVCTPAFGVSTSLANTIGEKNMRTYYTIALAMLAGVAIGSAAVNALHAQVKPPLYVVSEIDVTNPDAYGKEYAPKAQALIKAAGGRFVAIGGVAGAGAAKVTAVEGEAPKRTTIQVWDSMEQYQAYRNSTGFKEVRQVGDKYAKFRTFAVEGVAQ